MAKGFLMTRSSPRPGFEEEWLTWYRTYFTPLVVSLPGFVSARVLRFQPPPDGSGSPNEHSFVCLYELEADDLREPIRRLYELETNSDDRVKITHAHRREPRTVEWLYEDVFFTQKPSSREDLDWTGPVHDFETTRTHVQELLGWSKA